MSARPRIVVLGAGFAGQTAVLHLSRHLRRRADIHVVSPFPTFTWIPSLIWVGVGSMPPEATQFLLEPVYNRLGVQFTLGRAVEIHPEDRQVVIATATGDRTTLGYDFLVNATGPYLNFEGTPGLGPAAGNSWSVCTVAHATHARDEYLRVVAALERGQKARLVVGTGHPLATCEGAAFEYVMNVDADLRRRGVRDRAELTWLSNEPEAGDFGVGGIEAGTDGRVARSSDYVGGLLAAHGIRPILGAGVTTVRQGSLDYDTLRGDGGTLSFDYAMLIPQFRGVPLRYVGRDGADLAPEMTAPSGLMKVDADYAPKDFAQFAAGDWPATYRSPRFPEISAPGIAFAPPHPISRPGKSPAGLGITATPPRTGMAAGIMGRIVALNIVDAVEGRPAGHAERMSEMPGACIASTNKSLLTGAAVSIIMYPVVRDFARYPEYGRDVGMSTMEEGLAGAWIKRMLHTAFMWKFRARPGWALIPE